MAERTHYDNLKVTRNAPPEVIKAAYKTLAQKHHPDRNNGSAESERIMKIINDAYAVLSDPVKRQEYDNRLKERERAEQQQSQAESNWHRQQAEQAQRRQAQWEQAQREQAQREQAQREQQYEAFRQQQAQPQSHSKPSKAKLSKTKSIGIWLALIAVIYFALKIMSGSQTDSYNNAEAGTGDAINSTSADLANTSTQETATNQSDDIENASDMTTDTASASTDLADNSTSEADVNASDNTENTADMMSNLSDGITDTAKQKADCIQIARNTAYYMYVANYCGWEQKRSTESFDQQYHERQCQSLLSDDEMDLIVTATIERLDKKWQEDRSREAACLKETINWDRIDNNQEF